MRKLLILLFALLVIISTIVIAYVIQHRPSYDGEISIQGLEAPVEVIFDEYGIPHIYAENEADLYRAFGYVHAQERLFQMDILRRVGGGSLSEIIGKDALQVDLFFRTLGVSKSAKEDAKMLEASGSETLKAAQAYLEGVNDFIENGYSPIEYALLGVEPEPFTMEDIFNSMGYMAFSFAQAQKTEPMVQMIYEKYGEEYLADLDLDVTKNPQLILNHVPGMDSIAQMSNEIAAVIEQMPVAPFIGSNSWVLGPSKTQSGKVILANDPHIAFAQPAVWYEAHLESGDFRFYGYHIAGIPFGVIGHNPYLGWGLTMFENDDLDLYFEKINPDNDNQVWVNDHWEELDVREEVISIKGEEDTVLVVKESRHGPIINEVLNSRSEKDMAVAAYWIYTQFNSPVIDILYDMGRATGIEEMEKLISNIHAPGLNVMYGDAEGNIAWWAVGKLPIRPEHVHSKMILDGSTGKDDYLGYYDFSYNPKAINPPWGYVYSANNQTDSLNGIRVPGYYLPEDRAKRIVQLLESKEKWEVKEVMDMMNDVTSSVAPDISKAVCDIVSETHSDYFEMDDKHEKILSGLREWDGNFDLDSWQSTIYARLVYEIQVLTYKDEMGSAFNEFVGIHLAKRSLAPLVYSDSNVWYDNIETEPKENRADIVNQAYLNSIESLTAQLGENPEEWEWHRVHSLEHVHPIGRKKPMDKFFNVGPYPINGTNEVINNLMFDGNPDGEYKVKAGPSKRRIIDFSNVESTYSIIPTGQSGNFLSQHYMDQAEMYNEGKFRKQMMNRESIMKYKESILVLQPE